jgi:hypothetical protein
MEQTADVARSHTRESVVGRVKFAKNFSDKANAQLLDSNWGLVFVSNGLHYVKDQMCGYYGNVGVIAALMGGFTISVAVAPHDGLLEDKIVGPVCGGLGCVSFVLFFSCVLDCIFIDNTLRQISSEKAFLELLTGDAKPKDVAEAAKYSICGGHAPYVWHALRPRR